MYKCPFIPPKEKKSLEDGSTRNACDKKKEEKGKFYGSHHDSSFHNYLRHMPEHSLKKHIVGKEILPPKFRTLK